MISPEGIHDFLEPLSALQRLLTHFDDQGIIIGGIAASLLGKPRLTADLDAMFLLPVSRIPELIQAAEDEGIFPRINDVVEFARRNRVLLLVHQQSGIRIDLSLGALPFEQEAVERSELFQVGSLSLRLPTPEDLIILKAVAHRPKDLEDIQAVVDSHPNLDRLRIETWVKQFAEVLQMPELLTDVKQLLS